ncbi:MAG: M14 family zinc carboxypeptidase [Pyrinomonadaceae bacterium]
MKAKSAISRFFLFLLTAHCLLLTANAQIPAPKDSLGFTPGDDRKLASWAQIVGYFQKLDAASDRVQFKEIGKTTEGRPFTYALISTPENLAKLDYYKDINDKLADPRQINRDERKALDLIKKGKTFVLITCGIHSTEVGSTLSSALIAHRLASSEDKEIKNILENTIIVLVPSLNPDGVDIVKNWYDKTLGTPFEGTSPPELYHKYVGHDDNRDWYAFTQVETQLTVDQIHNVYHPQIVHDIHQQGQNAARFFLPPYEPPVEPNVPKELVEGYTELGLFMAKEMREKGFEGITTDTTYDAWTPARAYSHYHGGVRILSETASADLATPIEVKFEDLRGRLGYDAKKESKNFGPVWKGGRWTMRDITNYMETGALTLLRHASDNRERWLSRFYAIGREATRSRGKGELFGFIITAPEPITPSGGIGFIADILNRADVEVYRADKFSFDGKTYPKGTMIVKMDQPYGSFAKAVLEKQTYPNLKDESGNPIPPYDVTAHTLSLLADVEAIPVFSLIKYKPAPTETWTIGYPGCISQRIMLAIYKSHIPSMDEGWTRWILGEEKIQHRPYLAGCVYFGYNSTNNEQIKNNTFNTFNLPGAVRPLDLLRTTGVILFPDQSPNQILNGYPKGSMPDEYVGGLGKEGVGTLKKFVEDGGTLVFLNRSSDFAIREFDLPVRDVTDGLDRKDFYIPGSILRTELDTNHPIAKGMPRESIAWFEGSPAFEITESEDTNVEIIARYPKDPKDILLSGWALGAEKLAGKAALVSINIGKGRIVLFGFRPQYRGQSVATYPLLFNAIAR